MIPEPINSAIWSDDDYIDLANPILVNVTLAEGVTPAEAETRIKRLVAEHIDKAGEASA